ncbi:uncharacterized protein KY384_008874 [Bacidia gigantensis]|uniref:uncharacterized protein n=1 Tax=Bacidia gigantensis TaxID=2732470 RepID=UPI001D04486D|nr:uncharacterized protein KY384_008874 [Bacidia gigantensis]KAG8525230.1 hypothetical protein KY384_008874 [Bacidia gigantensis]
MIGSPTFCRLLIRKTYDLALRLTKIGTSPLPLLLNRAHARNALGHFDEALLDAKIIIKNEPDNEKALFRSARALYGLRRYDEAYATVTKVVTLNPSSAAAKQDLKRCEQRLKEQKGDYDYGSMLREANEKNPKADMDRASFLGPVEVRQCAVKEHGRGLFATRDVQAGEELLIEKAFMAAFPVPDKGTFKDDFSYGEDGTMRLGEGFWTLKENIAENLLSRLDNNPSLMKEFASLYPGPNAKEEVDPKLGHPELTLDMINFRIMYNSFAFPVFSHLMHKLVARAHDDQRRKTPAHCMGVWINASFVNHSCYPNVRRSFLGDMMIFRARQDIPANTELFIEYAGSCDDEKDRENGLEKYGFQCQCSICKSQRNTSAESLKKRKQIKQKLVDSFENMAGTDLEQCFRLLGELDDTYEHPASQEPRTAFVVPCMDLIYACVHGEMWYPVVKLGLIMLTALGFSINVTAKKFEITKWGFGIDEVVACLADMWTAFGRVEPGIVDDVENCVRKAYRMMAGEEVSFAQAYGMCQPEIPKPEDPDMETLVARLNMGLPTPRSGIKGQCLE